MHVLEAGRLAPSAVNRQPWHFIVITGSNVKERLADTYSKDWFIQAQVIIVACADPNEAWLREDGGEYWKIDAAIALQKMILFATKEGLETWWLVNFDEQAANGAFGISPYICVVAITPLGYSDEVKGEVYNRKPIEKVIHLEHW
ncbi:MAG: nitroreductase family protein [Candidatus Methylarchaceae archaeon HK02M1]|nr:nitroreductase family protein [Candidatus Methylarchaceae archaeon HK01M]MCP8312622.1 nitroreductase family protein [Candidatus Methylarchaceae archaeon HK02M1]